MKADLGDLNAFVAVARARGFRDGARLSGSSASGLSEAVRRLETQLGVRLLNRTTRSVVPTEAGARLLERLAPALTEVEEALDVVNGFRDRPVGTLRLNVPASAARLVLPDGCDAAVAMELGCDGVLMNTAIAEAKDPVRMARAMKLAVEAGRHAYLAGRMATRKYADPSSPLAGLI